MPTYYATMLTSTALPADQAFSDLTVRIHRDDSGVPDTLAVAAAGEYRIFLLSDPTTQTAAAPEGYLATYSNSSPANGTARTVAAGVTLAAGRYLVGGIFVVSGGTPTFAGQPFAFNGTDITMTGIAYGDNTNIVAGVLDLATQTTGDFVARAMTSATNWRGIELVLFRIGARTLGTAVGQRGARNTSASLATIDFASNGVSGSPTIVAGGGLITLVGRTFVAGTPSMNPVVEGRSLVYERTGMLDALTGVGATFQTGLSASTSAVRAAWWRAESQPSLNSAILCIPLSA